MNNMKTFLKAHLISLKVLIFDILILPYKIYSKTLCALTKNDKKSDSNFWVLHWITKCYDAIIGLSYTIGLILFFLSLGITFYLITNNFYYLIFCGLGIIGDNVIRLKDAIIWQTICIEKLRLTNRNDTLNLENNNYKVNINKIENEELKEKRKKVLFLNF